MASEHSLQNLVSQYEFNTLSEKSVTRYSKIQGWIYGGGVCMYTLSHGNGGVRQVPCIFHYKETRVKTDSNFSNTINT